MEVDEAALVGVENSQREAYVFLEKPRRALLFKMEEILAWG